MKEIIDSARDIFDSVGVIIENQKTFLILGLASKPDRDIDTYISDGKKWKFTGFFQHVRPRVEEVIKIIKERGYKAKKIVYSELDIKRMAIRAGIGSRGKN